METSPVKRGAAFGLIVLAFAALGAYLLVPAHEAARRSGRRDITQLPSAHPGPARSPAATSPAPVRPDIYQWLPFTQAGLAAAATTVIRFGDAYGTFSYTESAAGYAASLRAVTSPQLLAQISAAYSAAGVASARFKARQVAAASTVVDSIRAFGATSLTFAVQVTQRLVSLSGSSQSSTSYAVTVTGTGTSWLVSDVELASAGDS
jgi:hypothetical protein